MNTSLWTRRKLMIYFGLGIAGATAIGINSHQKDSNKSIVNAPTSSGTTPIAKSDNSPAPPPDAAGEKLPELVGITDWLNSDPLTIASLKGNVVLLQFWTFACINCQHTLPYITRWYRDYAPHGLKVIGVHTPEFGYERDLNNIKNALAQHQITYPVPVDNGYKTWNAYNNQYWPHLFLADRQGILRYDHIGEHAYAETEQMIRKFLG